MVKHEMLGTKGIKSIMQHDVQMPHFSPQPYIVRMQGDKSMEGIYLVFPASGEAERVNARTASEAIKKSSIKNPIRVLRHNPLGQTLLQDTDFVFEDDDAAVSPAEGVSPAMAAAALAPADEAPSVAGEAAEATPDQQAEAPPAE